jgi:N-formylglutamate amidohydrolase
MSNQSNTVVSPSSPPGKGPIFTFYQALTKAPKGLISMPHSGEEFPREFKEYLVDDHQKLMKDTDFRVFELVDLEKLRKAGFAILISHIHRTCIDLNRSRENSCLYWKKNTHGDEIVIKNPTQSTEEKLLGLYYDPYYEILENTGKASHEKQIFIDLHSMPSTPTAYHLKKNPNQPAMRPEICLSDFHGKTAPREFMEKIQKAFIDQGLNAKINDPYFGGHITQFLEKYRCSNLQIELNRSVYMDEKLMTIKDESPIKSKLTDILINLTSFH